MRSFDRDLLADFERRLDPADPTGGKIPVKIIGYGEISTVFAFSLPGFEGLVFKRMPAFPDEAAVGRYRAAVDAYRGVLAEVGIHVVPTECVDLANPRGGCVVYLVQERVERERLGNVLLKSAGEAVFDEMLNTILDRLTALWRRNARLAGGEQVGLDAQISNWAFVPGPDGALQPLYFDIGTPLLRRGGREVLDTEVFLKSMPGFLAWVVRGAVVQEILDRYYDLGAVLTDLVANWHKEGCAERIPGAVDRVNGHFAERGDGLAVPALSAGAIAAYYKRDARIWTALLAFRRLDRWWKTRVRRAPYDFILPGKIRR